MTRRRPLWLTTLADLSLLLVGFFVLLQSRGNHGEIAQALTARFARVDTPLAVAAEAVHGFAPGSAVLPRDPERLRVWAGERLRDPRVVLTVTGGVDGSAADVDPQTGSSELLAADRARAVAALIAPIAPTRVRTDTAIGTGSGTGGRTVIVTLAFAGERNIP